MTERPILFNDSMAAALLDGTTTQTRRIVKGIALEWLTDAKFTLWAVTLPEIHFVPRPPQPSDRL